MSNPRPGLAPKSSDTAYADTNLFVALLVGSGHPLHDAAIDVFRRVADRELALIVTPIVVAELVYVARSLLRWTRKATSARLGALLHRPQVSLRAIKMRFPSGERGVSTPRWLLLPGR